MKNLSISTYGVEGMSNEEAIDINGGNPGRVILFILELLGAASVADEAYRGFRDGWKEAGRPECDAVSGA